MDNEYEFYGFEKLNIANIPDDFTVVDRYIVLENCGSGGSMINALTSYAYYTGNIITLVKSMYIGVEYYFRESNFYEKRFIGKFVDLTSKYGMDRDDFAPLLTEFILSSAIIKQFNKG